MGTVYKYGGLYKYLRKKPRGARSWLAGQVKVKPSAITEWLALTADHTREILYTNQLRLCEVLKISLEELNTPYEEKEED